MHTSAVAHIPVMLDEVVHLLGPALAKPGAVLVDATIGLAGHSAALLEAFPHVRLIGIDRDPQALALSKERLGRFGSRVSVHHGCYDRLAEVLADLNIACADGVLLDLGVSSMQLNLPERGFSYAKDAPLDMRMDPGEPLTARDVINGYDVPALTKVLREFGEERFAHRIAKAIARERASTPIETTGRLSDVVKSAIPAAARRTGGNPVKRTFQALRIEVNHELEVLRAAMPLALQALCMRGRIVVLTYHSLEDRIVKHALRGGIRPDIPVELRRIVDPPEPWLVSLTSPALTPSNEELHQNPRAASARLRAAERIGWAA